MASRAEGGSGGETDWLFYTRKWNKAWRDLGDREESWTKNVAAGLYLLAFAPFNWFVLIYINLDIRISFWSQILRGEGVILCATKTWLLKWVSACSSGQQNVEILHAALVYQLKATQETRWGLKYSTSNWVTVFSSGLSMGLHCSLLF